MVVEWFLGLMVGLVGWISDVMTWDGPDPADVFASMEGLVTQFASIGVWVDWAAISAALAVSVGVWLACAGVKLLRAVASYLPLFGGAG